MDVLEERRLRDDDSEEVELRLVDIVHFFKANLRKIIIGGIIGLILGALYIVPKPNVYTVEVTIMPETQGRSLGNLSGFIGGMGLGGDNGSAGDAIRPDLYPNVLESVPFAMSMLNKQVYSKDLGAAMTLEEFIKQTSTPGLFDKIRALFASDDNSNTKVGKTAPESLRQTIQVTKGQYGLIKAVQESVSSSFDKRSGVITVTATEPDPMVAATVAQLTLNYLTDYITAYRTDKARRRVHFLSLQVNESKKRYEGAEYALSNYRDRNVSLYLQTAKIAEQRLQANFLLEQSVYNDLAKQLEQAKIKIEDDTPTFKTLQPAVVPLQKSGPKRTVTILGFGLLVAFIVSMTLFVRSRNLFS